MNTAGFITITILILGMAIVVWLVIWADQQ